MRVFNQKETAEILKTAAEKSHDGAESEGIGLTIKELEHVAAEAGIDPAEVNKAAIALDAKRQPVESSFWGGPFSFSEQVERDHEITVAEWEHMLVHIREFFQAKGDVHTRESVFEWSSPRGTTNAAHVTALKEDGKTKISVVWTGPLTALPYYLPVPLVGILSLPFASEFLGLGAVAGMSFVALSMGVTFAAGRWALRKNLSKGFAKLRNLAATLQGEATPSLLADEREPVIEPMTEPVIALDEEDTLAEVTEIREPRRAKE